MSVRLSRRCGQPGRQQGLRHQRVQLQRDGYHRRTLTVGPAPVYVAPAAPAYRNNGSKFRKDGDAEGPGLARQSGIERRQARPVAQCDIEDAAVRHLQSGADAKFGKTQRLVFVRSGKCDADGEKGIAHRRALIDADSPDEHLGQGDRMDDHLTRCRREQEAGRGRMVRISGIEIGDQDAGVQRDHVGQSDRSRSR